MKLKVKVAFRDKYTKEKYEVGDIITVSSDRGKELLAHPGKLVSVSRESKKKS